MNPALFGSVAATPGSASTAARTLWAMAEALFASRGSVGEQAAAANTSTSAKTRSIASLSGSHGPAVNAPRLL